jgi:CheY-like chemotaxis protein
MTETDLAHVQLGARRQTFVSTVGRKVAGIRALVPKLGSGEALFARNELKLRLLDLRNGARNMHASALEEELESLCATVETLLEERHLPEPLLADLDARIAELPTLAWGKFEVHASAEATYLQALVVGDAALCEPLHVNLGARGAYATEVVTAQAASLDFAIALSPDVIVIDGDSQHAARFAEAVMGHAQTESTPVVVIGHFDGPIKESMYVALGAARTMRKPISPDVYRRAIDMCTGTVRAEEASGGDFGAPTVSMLADRLARELYHALTDVAGERERTDTIALGQGTEVTAALWGAIARIQEVVTARSGARFRTRGPQGAVVLPSMIEPASTDVARRSQTPRGAAAELDLSGRKVLVVDDDAAVLWFLSDLLKNAGCTVLEATSGEAALELAHKHNPELVFADVVMPGLDGVALSRALKRDVLLRDVPVCLMSWKDDLLTRIRELGANADGYLRKEADASAVVTRAREALKTRAAIEARMQGRNEVKGRLDGITVFALLEMAAKIRCNARVSLRDGRYLYEVEIREGKPARAVRVDADGRVVRALPAIHAMLGITAGRFIVAHTTQVVEAEFETKALSELVRSEVLRRRELDQILAHSSLSSIAAVVVDDTRAFEFALDCPPAHAAFVRALCNNASLAAASAHLEGDQQTLETLTRLTSRGLALRLIDANGDTITTSRPRGLNLVARKLGHHETPTVGLGAIAIQQNTLNTFDATPPGSHSIERSTFALTQVDGTLYRTAKALSDDTAGSALPALETSQSAQTPETATAGDDLSMRTPHVARSADETKHVGSYGNDAVHVESAIPVRVDAEVTPGPTTRELEQAASDANKEGVQANSDNVRNKRTRKRGATRDSAVLITSVADAAKSDLGPAEATADQEPAKLPLKRNPFTWVALGATLLIALVGSIKMVAAPSSIAASAAPPSGNVQGNPLVIEGETRPGQGVISVNQGGAATIRIDGVARGASSEVRVAVSAGKHTVSVEGKAAVTVAEVVSGKVTMVTADDLH